MTFYRHMILFFLLFKVTTTLKCKITKDTEAECKPDALCYRNKDELGCRFKENCTSVTDRCADDEKNCCCDRNRCNDSKGNFLVFIIVGVAALLVGLAIVTVGLYYFLKKRKENAVYNPMAEFSGSTEEEHSADQPKSDSQSLSPIEKWKRTLKYDDCTTTKTDPTIPPSVLKEILKNARDPKEIDGEDEMTEAPHIAKIMAFSSTDTITQQEKPKKAGEDNNRSSTSSHAEAETCLLLLQHMAKSGPRQFPFKHELLKKCLQAAASVFLSEPSLLEVEVPCVVYGDIHGQYSDLLRWFNLNGWPYKIRCVFLGDFVDRGSHGVEVIALLACLKVVFPTSIFLCRGNHEEESMNKSYSFHAEVRQRFGENGKEVYAHFRTMFNALPLAARIGKRILGIHGGLSPQLNSFQDILDIERPIGDVDMGTLACDLMWSDPDHIPPDTSNNYRPNLDREPKLGIGQLFSATAVRETCKRLGIDLIIRGHQAPLHGYALWAGGRLITLFSAPGYKGKLGRSINMGASIMIAKDGTLTVRQIRVSEEFRRLRIEDTESRKKYIVEIPSADE